MGEWKEISLSNIIEIIGGGTPKTSIAEYWNGDIPWLSVADFNHGKKYVFDTEKKITEEGVQKSSTKILNKGDLIISARGTVGVVAMLGKDMAFNQSCYGIRAISKICTNDYIYYLLKDTITSFHKIAHGGVFDTITRDTFNEIKIFLPSLYEQNTITNILSNLDNKIDLLHRQNTTLEKIAETLFRQWFIEEVKEEWKDGIIEDILELKYGKALKEENRTGVGFPVIGSSGIVGYHSEYLVEGPGIVIGRKGTLGEVIFLTDNFFPIDTTYYIHSKMNTSEKYFEYFLLKTIDFKELNSDSAVPGLNRNIAHRVEVKIPPIELIQKFNHICIDFFEKLKNNKKQIQTLTSLRDTLLPKLMSGEIRVAD